jgi:hypothetical protein
LNVSFRRSLVVENLQSWHNLILRLTNIHLRDRTNVFKWSLNLNVQFAVRSMYQAFLDTNIVPHNNYLWKLKIPQKVKVLWLLFREAILTKDNLVWRNWHGNKMCCFCNSDETVRHLFFDCVLAKFIWKVIHLTFDLRPLDNIRHVFDDWVQNMKSNKKRYSL